MAARLFRPSVVARAYAADPLPSLERSASAVWTGSLLKGKGEFKSASGKLQGAYTVPTRFGDEKGTNPEELIASAHSSCFAMALSAQLGAAGLEPQRIDAKATVHMQKQDQGWTIDRIHLHVRAKVPGATAKAFEAAAEAAKAGCPISRALTPAITLDAKLDE